MAKKEAKLEDLLIEPGEPTYPVEELVRDSVRILGVPSFVAEGARVWAGWSKTVEVAVSQFRQAVEGFLNSPVERG